MLVVLVALLDVFLTVFFPASRHGPIRKPLATLVWHVFRLAARAIGGQRRRNFLSYSGPILIVATLTVWFCLLVLGWAMIYKPALASEIRASSGPTESGWTAALYFSGFTLTTLGVGDLAAKTGGYRLLSVAEAAVGFSFFSAVITYFLSVYSSLSSRNAFAEGLHQLTGNSDDASEALVRLLGDRDSSAARQRLSSAAEKLRQIHQAQRFYPVLRYFNYRESYYALPRILFTVLELTTLMRSALDREHYADLIDSTAAYEVQDAAFGLMQELLEQSGRGEALETERAWRERYDTAVQRLADAGVKTHEDDTDGANTYIRLRTEWDRKLRQLATNMLFEWDTR